MWAAQTWVWAGEWAAGSKRQPWFTGQACSFTREISRATINTTVSFKGAVYHTTGFEGPQTDLVFFVVLPPPPLSNVQWVWRQLNGNLPLLHFEWLLIDWLDFKTSPPSVTKSPSFASRVRSIYHLSTLKSGGGSTIFPFAVFLNKGHKHVRNHFK